MGVRQAFRALNVGLLPTSNLSLLFYLTIGHFGVAWLS